jgi:prevent-host-death family protein
MAKSIQASRFKATCLKLMDEVARTGEPIVITKNGRAVAQLAPVGEKPKSFFGVDAGKIEITGDIVAPIDVRWEANADPG